MTEVVKKRVLMIPGEGEEEEIPTFSVGRREKNHPILPRMKKAIVEGGRWCRPKGRGF